MDMFLELFLYFIWLIFTGFSALYPRAIWNKFGTAFYHHGEPTDFYFFMLRTVSAILFFIAIFGILQVFQRHSS